MMMLVALIDQHIPAAVHAETAEAAETAAAAAEAMDAADLALSYESIVEQLGSHARVRLDVSVGVEEWWKG